MHSGEWSAYMKSALYYFELNLIMIGLKHGKTELHLENWLNKVIKLDIFIRYLINTVFVFPNGIRSQIKR